MGQQKSKLYFDENNQEVGGVVPPPGSDHVQLRHHGRGLESREERRKKKRWRKKQGFSLPIEHLSAASSHTDLPDLEQDDAILVSYSQSSAEKFAHLRPVNRRRASSEEPHHLSNSSTNIVQVHSRPREVKEVRKAVTASNNVQVIRVIANDRNDHSQEASENFEAEESESEADWNTSQSSFAKREHQQNRNENQAQKWKLSLEIPDAIKIATTYGSDEKNEPPIIVSDANQNKKSPALQSLGREIFDELLQI